MLICPNCGKPFERENSEREYTDCLFLCEGTELADGDLIETDGCYETTLVSCPYCDDDVIVTAEFDYLDDAIDDQSEIEDELNREYEKMRL